MSFFDKVKRLWTLDAKTEREIREKYLNKPPRMIRVGERIEKKKIKDIKRGDEVRGTDGEFYPCELQPVREEVCYEVITSQGSVICSWNHEWVVRLNGSPINTHRCMTQDLDSGFIKRFDFVTIESHEEFVELLGIKRLKDKRLVKCISVDSPDHLFKIYTDKGVSLFTSNCQNRVVAGRVNSTQSMMALGNTLGTAIRGDIKGRGIVSVNGILENLQIYFENPSWLTQWYHDRGMDECGYDGTESDEEVIVEGEEDIVTTNTKLDMTFEDIHKEVNSYVDQNFRVLSE